MISGVRPALIGLLFCVACSHHPLSPAPGTATLWGYVRLVPRAGVTPGRKTDTPYSDPVCAM